MNKSLLRKLMLKERGALSENFVRETSKKIVNRFLSLYGNESSYLLYLDFRNEVATKELMETLCADGKDVFLPKIIDGEIELGKYDGPESLVVGAYGISEPKETLCVSSVDVTVVPGVAFDEKCNRIGFGKGYYDKLLHRLESGKNVGLAYGFQVVEELETEEHDQPLDCVITEELVIRRN